MNGRETGSALNASLLLDGEDRILEGNRDAELMKWIDLFERDKNEAGLTFWYETHKGIQESLREF